MEYRSEGEYIDPFTLLGVEDDPMHELEADDDKVMYIMI